MLTIILAGGRGKRLRPLTDFIPKPLVSLQNIPIIEWQIRYLKKFGVTEVIICTGYKSTMIEHFFKQKNNFDIKVHFSVETSSLGTGGAIKQAGVLIDDKSFFVMNGDVITNLDLKKLMTKPNSIASIGLKTKFGTMQTDGNLVTGFQEKGQLSNIWMNAGIYYLQKETLADLPKTGAIETSVFPQYANSGKLHSVQFNDAKWYSIDSFSDMEECSLEIDRIIK